LSPPKKAARAQDMNDIPKMDSEDDHPCDAEFEVNMDIYIFSGTFGRKTKTLSTYKRVTTQHL